MILTSFTETRERPSLHSQLEASWLDHDFGINLLSDQNCRKEAMETRRPSQPPSQDPGQLELVTEVVQEVQEHPHQPPALTLLEML